MSTRSTTHFTDGDETKPVAIIYRHSDGYPEGAGKDLRDFLRACQKLKDSRLDDPSYLAAKYVVFLADKFVRRYDYGKNQEIPSPNPRHLRAVGDLMQDPVDIAYRYVVDC